MAALALIVTTRCITRDTLARIIQPTECVEPDMDKYAKSRTARPAPKRIVTKDLFGLMSEIISLRERVAQAELAVSHLKSLSDVPAPIIRAKTPHRFSRRIAGSPK